MLTNICRVASAIRVIIESIIMEGRKPLSWESANIQDAIEHLQRGWYHAAENSAFLAAVSESSRSPSFPRAKQMPLSCQELMDSLKKIESKL